MKRIESDGYFVDDNNIKKASMRFYTNIRVKAKDNKIVCELVVFNQKMEAILLEFDSLEESFEFNESIVNNSYDFSEIFEGYELYLIKDDNKELIRRKAN